jgi:hypothetical protein
LIVTTECGRTPGNPTSALTSKQMRVDNWRKMLRMNIRQIVIAAWHYKVDPENETSI